MKEKLKLIIQQSFKIAIGILFIYYFINFKKSEYPENDIGYFEILFVLLISYLLLIFLLLINGKRENWKKPYSVINSVIILSGFFGIIAESMNSHKILKHHVLFFNYGIAGIFLSILGILILSKLDYLKIKGSNIISYLVTIFSYSLFGIFLASTINRSEKFEQLYIEKTVVIEKAIELSEDDEDEESYWINAIVENEVEKLQVEYDEWSNTKIGDSIKVEYKEGVLGYFVIENIN